MPKKVSSPRRRGFTIRTRCERHFQSNHKIKLIAFFHQWVRMLHSGTHSTAVTKLRECLSKLPHKFTMGRRVSRPKSEVFSSRLRNIFEIDTNIYLFTSLSSLYCHLHIRTASSSLSCMLNVVLQHTENLNEFSRFFYNCSFHNTWLSLSLLGRS